MKASKVIHVVIPKTDTTRSVIVSNKHSTRSKYVEGDVIRHYNSTGEPHLRKDYPIQQLSELRFKDEVIDALIPPPIQPRRTRFYRIYDQITVWMDPAYSVFMKDNAGVSYIRDIELSYDDWKYTDFTSSTKLRKSGWSFLGKTHKRNVDLTIIYTEDGKTFICSRNESHPVELPGIKLLKVNIRLNPTHVNKGTVEVDLVYDNPGSEQPGIIPLRLNYTPKKRFRLMV